MPSYDYVCKDCSERFEVRASVTEYSKASSRIVPSVSLAT